MGSPVWYCGAQSWECPAGAPEQVSSLVGPGGMCASCLGRPGAKRTRVSSSPARRRAGSYGVNSALNGSYSGFLYVLTRQTGLLDPGMLVNIQQPLIREDERFSWPRTAR